MSFKMLLLPPDVNESWPEKIRQVAPGAVVKVFRDPKDALADIEDADAAYGTVPPELFAEPASYAGSAPRGRALAATGSTTRSSGATSS